MIIHSFVSSVLSMQPMDSTRAITPSTCAICQPAKVCAFGCSSKRNDNIEVVYTVVRNHLQRLRDPHFSLGN